MNAPLHPLLAPLRRMHDRIRDKVVAAGERAAGEELARVSHEDVADTIYAVDRISEQTLIEFVEHQIASHTPVVLIAEGLPNNGQVVLPAGTRESDARWRIIVDPIDGTRGLMYQKRSAWILTGVAPNRGPATSLADIELALQTEIPLVKQHLSDTVWAVRGQGTMAERWNRLTGEGAALPLHPSNATTIAHGFANIAKFFPGDSQRLAAVTDQIAHGALGPAAPGKALCFEDQYISTGGQLYEIMTGHDRFTADVRPVLAGHGLCAHPYDLCTELVARELGVIVTDENGQPLHAPLDVTTNVAWIAYANPVIRAQIEPLLQAALRQHAHGPVD